VPRPENSVDAETHLGSLGRMNHALRTVRSLASLVLTSSWHLVKISFLRSCSRGNKDVLHPGAFGVRVGALRSREDFTLYRVREHGNSSLSTRELIKRNPSGGAYSRYRSPPAINDRRSLWLRLWTAFKRMQP